MVEIVTGQSIKELTSCVGAHKCVKPSLWKGGGVAELIQILAKKIKKQTGKEA